MHAAVIRLGPFAVDCPIAQGGMGEVWRGHHLAQATPVAVKVIRPDVLTEALVEALRDEIRAVAALDHPHVVWIYDRGTVGPEAAEASGGRLAEGSEWLAMELADGGTLKAGDGWDYARLREVALDLLDALAHAHARGVVHRDLKPGNVLFGGQRPGLKLTDFGMVFAVEQALEGGRAPLFGGTPAWMAPEQFEADWREQGPWTDLYSLGCLIHALCSGRPPYAGKDWHRLAEQHRAPGCPPLASRFPVPDGMAGWIARMMAPRIRDRYGSAAEAAWDLARLEAPREPARAPASVALPTDTTRPVAGVIDPVRTTLLLPMASLSASLPEPGGSAPRRPDPLPFPADWRQPHSDRPIAMSGAGIGLFGLRAAPLVDREPERDLLWAALRQVHATRRARVVAMLGRGGTGKSELARWLGRRAYETGAAEPVRARYDAAEGAQVGLAGLLGRELRCTGLARFEMLGRVTALAASLALDDLADVHRIVELVQPAGPDDPGPRVHFSAVTERFALVARVLAGLAGGRPLVVWLDDVHASDEGLAFTEWVQRHAEALPALLVLTARDEDLDGPRKARFGRVATEGAANAILLEPLPASHRAELVQGLLALEPGLTARVVERTEGNPLFAVQMIGDWVDRGLLSARPDGYHLPAQVELAADLAEVWAARLRELRRGAPRDWLGGLEVAATLGQDVDRGEWDAVCASLGLAPEGLLEAMVARGLALSRRRSEGWAFAHGSLRDLLLERSRTAGRSVALHRACAEVVANRPGTAATARAGLLWLGAEEYGLAADALLLAARASYNDGFYSRAETLLEAVQAAVTKLPAADERRALHQLQRNTLWSVTGRHQAAKAATRELLDACLAHGWRKARIQALGLDSRLAETRVRGPGERFSHEVALEEAEALGDAEFLAKAHQIAAEWTLVVGPLEDAARHAAESVRLFEEIGWRRDAMAVRLTQAALALSRRRWAEAEAVLELTVRFAEADGQRWILAEAEMRLGELARFRGQLEAASRHYERSWRLLDRIGHYSAWMARINLGLTEVERGRPDDARQHLEPSLSRSPYTDYAAHLGLMACEAASVHHDAFRGHLEAVQAWAAGGSHDADVARICELAGARALEAGHEDRARAAWALAAAQLDSLGRPEDAAALRARAEAGAAPAARRRGRARSLLRPRRG